MKWKIVDNKLVKEFTITTFTEAIAFTNAILPVAEKASHHPDMLIHSYNKVLITLYTHSENTITEKDYSLAEQIDSI